MIFSLIILVMIGVIAFFHYVQGVLSATLSAILAIFAAVLAVSYTEPLVLKFFATGAFADYAYSAILVALFALIYLVGRLLFDKAIPGNVQLPVVADKVGAGVMGVVAGIFATGIFAIAAEAMPFGTTFGMYSLYPATASRPVTITGDRRGLDATIYDEVRVMTLEDTKQRGGTWIQVADTVLGLTQHLSAGGSLAGARPLHRVHPDLMQELFGQRTGIEVGARHVAANTDEVEQVRLVGVFTADRLPSATGVPSSVRTVDEPNLLPPSGKTLLIIRLGFDANASSENDILHVSTGAVRLVAGDGTDPNRNWTNFFPVGTLHNSRVLLVNKPTDPLFLGAGNGADFVFLVDTAAIFNRQSDPQAPATIRDGTFVEAKRFGRIDLSGTEVRRALPPAEETYNPFRTAEVLQTAGQPVPARNR